MSGKSSEMYNNAMRIARETNNKEAQKALSLAKSILKGNSKSFPNLYTFMRLGVFYILNSSH